jgi:GTP-binding protein YchF
VPAAIEFVDIAGLVKGASTGAGLGNKFLANIREVDAIIHVVRCFDNDDIIHVAGSIDPVRDIEIINMELILADMAQAERRLDRARKDVRFKKEAQIEVDALEKIVPALQAGLPARSVSLTEDEAASIKPLGLLSRKPIIFAATVNEDDLATGNAYVESVRKIAKDEGAEVIVISAQVESELIELSDEDRQEFLESLGVQEGGLQSLIRTTYDLLGLQTYFTCGPKETRAWTITKGMTAPQAAGVIHSDLEKGFIRAEVMKYAEWDALGGEDKLKAAGKLYVKGKDYTVEDGDILNIRFSV